MKYNKIIAVTTTMVLLGITGCGNAENISKTEPEKESNNVSQVDSSDIFEKEKEEVTIPESVITDDYSKAYADALTKILEEQIMPDGTSLEFTGDFNDIQDNSFAVCDVDEDGIQELILEWKTSAMACMAEYVWEYNPENNSFEEQLLEFPGVEFYHGGLATVGWSHNQGMGEMWPYNIYEFDSEKGSYEYKGCVESWNKEFGEKNFNDKSFPTDVDTDNAGVVYSIEYGNEYPSEYYSQSDYDAFYEKLMTQRKKMDIKFYSLKSNLIQKLRENKLNPVITGKTVYPNIPEIDTEKAIDGTFSVSIDPSYIFDDEDGTYTVYANIYQKEIYDVASMNSLTVGDGVECNELVIKIDSIENGNGFISINGGVEEGGLDFSLSNEDNCYVFSGLSDVATYKKCGLTNLKMTNKTVITDKSNLDKPEGVVVGLDSFQNYIFENNISIDFLNTVIKAENSEIVELTIYYRP